MATADSQWPRFYLGMQQLAQPGQHLADGDTLELALQHSVQLAVLFIELAQHNPASVIAQLNLTARQLSPGQARAVKALTLGLIFSRSYGWQAARSQLFLQAIILPAVFTPQANSSAQAQLLTAKALQHANRQHPLLPLLIAACNVRQQPPWQLHPDGPLLNLANQLAAQLLPAAGNQLALEQLLLKYQSGQADSSQQHWFCLLQQLCAAQALPGRFAKALPTARQAQSYWFISGIAATEQQAPATVYVRQFDPAAKTIGRDVTQLPLSELTLLGPQYFRESAWLALLEPAPELLPRVTEVKLESCLENSLYPRLAVLSLTAQVNALADLPLISQFLLHAAQQISRQQLPVSRLRHAISMLGQDALSDWLAQAELHQFCCQLAHPHQPWLEQLQRCLQHALLLVSDNMRQPMASSTAGLITRCASLSLWQQPATVNIALGRHVQGQQLLGQIIQQHIWQAADYPQTVSKLLSHYQQPQWAKAANDWQHRQPAQLTVLLRFSWQLCLSVYCASEQNQQRLSNLLPVASAHLGLAQQPAIWWQQQLMASSECYYPLPEM
ncbi:hypothetical protein WG68_01560 [Arsukibacterium ikkense]|uniref:Uncharacterized protein n=2 Tax=Arsukibacterium ikkense TaxID=336831 RepID=A0A0M2V920_9GAMM|nr:hypothetical protein WG68_01560 [Arsukibacterium ikkense]